MDKQEIYRKTEKAFQQALEAAKKSAKMVSKKAGEAAKVSKLLVEKFKLEHRVNKNFTELGHRVYDQAVKNPDEGFAIQPDLKRFIEEAKRLHANLSEVESRIDREMKKVSAAS